MLRIVLPPWPARVMRQPSSVALLRDRMNADRRAELDQGRGYIMPAKVVC